MAETSLKEKTVKGLVWGGISNGVQQIIGAVFGIFFARLLTQEDYGLVGTLAIFTGIVSLIQDSGFSAALINKKDFKHEDYNAVFWFGLLTGIITYGVLFFCAPLIAQFFKAPELIDISRVLFLWFLIGGANSAHSAIMLKRLMVKERAIIAIIALILSNGAGLTLALKGFAYWALVIQTVIHAFVMAILTWIYSPWRPTFKIKFTPLKEMLSFSSKLLITGIFNLINSNIFAILLGRYYDTKKELGEYNQANKWTTMGFTLIGGIIGGVAHPVLAEVSHDKERHLFVFRKMMRFTAFISFPAMFGLAFISNELIILTITDKWLTSIPLMQLLCIGAAFLPIASLYSFLFISLEKSDINMWNIISAGIVQLIAALLMLQHGVLNMVIVYVSINITWIFINYIFANRLIQYKFIHMLMDIIPFLISATIAISSAHYITSFLENMYIVLCAKIIIAAGIYIAIMKLTNAKIFQESIAYILKKKQ